MTGQHPHIDVLRRWFDAFDRSDLDAARALLATDAVLRVTKPESLSGNYVGFDGFLEFSRSKQATSGEGFSYRVDELLAGDRSAAAILTLSSFDGEARREWSRSPSTASSRTRSRRCGSSKKTLSLAG